MSAQAGKVRNHAKNNSPAIFGLVPFLLQRPIPIIAQVLACVVAVGSPRKEHTPKKEDEAVSAALLLKGSREVSSHPTFLIMREPPIRVPSVIAAAQATVIYIGILNSSPVLIEVFPLMKVSPSM